MAISCKKIMKCGKDLVYLQPKAFCCIARTENYLMNDAQLGTEVVKLK